MPTAPTLPFHPQGYLSMATNLGIKDTTLDFTVILFHGTSRGGGRVHPESVLQGPRVVGRERLADGMPRPWSSTVKMPCGYGTARHRDRPRVYGPGR
jgi:hypothetical protein